MRTAALLLVAACSTTPTRSATGELGAWQAGPALPTPRANHCSAAIDNWVLVIGGNYQSNGTFVKTDEIHAAPLAADGTLGSWQLAGHTPSPVSECTATADGRRLYVIDGLYDTDTDSRKVYTADLDAHGMLSPLASMTDLPTIAISSEATVHGRDLVVMHSSLDTDATGELSTPVTAPTWTTTDLGITFRAQPQYAFTATHAYTLGGYHDTSAVLADAFVAPLAGGPAVPTTPLPTPTGFGEAVAVDDYVFLVGGRTQVFGGSGTTATYAAHIEAGGALEAWQPATALPMGRTNHDLVRVGDFLVLTGGATSGGGDATVLVSQVRY
ncbi:MAG: hypothetical protein JO257_23570 [Deltaproteobacteria bacterium]|nr:hypothetical protein [Deltaproteobacteria bacterium]